MPGVKYMASSMSGETQYYSVLFMKNDIRKLMNLSDKQEITGAELVRRAVEEYLLKYS
tara:strand:- start:13793 stop:13966 length:174 start_codon:yes stop_codon:yes gene_type:complete